MPPKKSVDADGVPTEAVEGVGSKSDQLVVCLLSIILEEGKPFIPPLMDRWAVYAGSERKYEGVRSAMRSYQKKAAELNQKMGTVNPDDLMSGSAKATPSKGRAKKNSDDADKVKSGRVTKSKSKKATKLSQSDSDNELPMKHELDDNTEM